MSNTDKPSIMNSAAFLAVQESARALGFELMARIVLTPTGAILAKAQSMSGRLQTVQDFAEAGTVGFTLRKASLVPRPADHAGEAFSFVPHRGDEQFERSFEKLASAKAWLSKLVSTPEVARREPITAFEPGVTASILFVPAQRPASEERESAAAPSAQPRIHHVFDVSLPAVHLSTPIHVHTTETKVSVNLPEPGATEEIIERNQRDEITRVVKRPLEPQP